MDYAGNAKKGRDPDAKKKEIVKVISGDVVVKKPSFGQKVKDIFVEMDVRTVARYVVTEVMLPAARDMLYDAATKGVGKMMYGDGQRGPRRGALMQPGRASLGGSPIYRDYRHPATRPPMQTGSAYPRVGRNDFILATHDEATNVLEAMHDILEAWDVVSVADLHELMGLPSSHTDEKWGWRSLIGSGVRPIREGFLIELPPVEPI